MNNLSLAVTFIPLVTDQDLLVKLLVGLLATGRWTNRNLYLSQSVYGCKLLELSVLVLEWLWFVLTGWAKGARKLGT